MRLIADEIVRGDRILDRCVIDDNEREFCAFSVLRCHFQTLISERKRKQYSKKMSDKAFKIENNLRENWIAEFLREFIGDHKTKSDSFWIKGFLVVIV